MNEYSIDSVLKREFQDIDGKRSWRISNEIWKMCVEYGKQIEKLARKECVEDAEKKAEEKYRKEIEKLKGSKSGGVAGRKLTDEERAAEVMAFLDEKLQDRTLTAAELAQFKDIFNLKARDQDITIEMTDFRAVDPAGAKILEAVGMFVEAAQ